MGLTHDMLATVQWMLMMVSHWHPSQPFVIRLERIEAYLIRRYNRG